MADDRVRLARAFGIEPLPPWRTLAAGAGLASLGAIAGVVGFAPSAALLAMYVAERRKVAAALREVERWGFPVAGYRAWLLAPHPSFELELGGELGSSLVEQALAAVDPAIEVERRGSHVVRVTTPRVTIPWQTTGGEVAVGDRKLLAEIGDRVLAPLHADVGIVAMRMGDRDALGAVGPIRRHELGAGFRDQALAAPPALQALVHTGTARMRPSSEARHQRLRDDRVLHAAGEQPTPSLVAGAVTLVGTVAGAVVAGAGGGWLGAGLGLAGGIAAILRIDRNRAHAVARSLDGLGFPVEGYGDWLISARPVMDVEVRSDPGRPWVARAMLGIDHKTTWIGDTLLRIETPPLWVTPTGTAIAPFWGGDRAVAERIARALLVPLHDRVGIVAVRMGGFVDRRE